MKTNIILIVIVISLFTLGSCSKSEGAKADVNEAKSVVLTKSQQENVEYGNDFAVELFKQVARKCESTVISPISTQLILGLINNGLVGDASDEVCSVLGYGSGASDAVNEYLLSLVSQLKELDGSVDFNVANIVMFNTMYDELGLKSDFKQVAKKYYSARIDEFDFSAKLDMLVPEINRWIQQETKGMINSIKMEPTPVDRLFAANAVYFSGKWQSKFDSKNTTKSDFRTESGSKTIVEMMYQKNSFEYGCGTGYSLVKASYGNGNYVMTIVLPDEENGLSSLVKNLSKDKWEEMMNSTKQMDVMLYLPKFKTNTDLLLTDPLSELGIRKLFDGTADFTGFANIDKAINFIRQNAVINVDESGVKAAAVTHAGLITSPAPDPNGPVTFKADRPFLYVISELSSGTIMFMGQYCGD